MNSKPSLEFYLALPPGGNQLLQMGCLLLKENDKSAGIKLSATSGCRGNQYAGSWKLKGRGPLPPSVAISPKIYNVSTQRLWLPNTIGVEGSFYAITPFSVPIAGGMHRGDFGVHFDANVPGSAGCIVIPIQDHWNTFRETLQKWRTASHQQVPLTVVYS